MTDKNYKFLIEKPSKDDLFDGGSHSRTATAVFNTLKDDNDINVIGIEGELGSGKSTILELIKIESENDSYEFIEFDVELYQHGATKKALIETLYKSIDDSIDIQASKDKLKRAKDIALGNQFEYTAQVNSNINIWIVWFVIALLAAARMLPEALVGIGNFVMFLYQLCAEDFTKASNKYAFSGLSLVSVFTIFLPWHIVRCAQKRSKICGLFGIPPSTGDLFKRNSRDKITESIEINKEVGAYELQEALQVFVSELPANKRLILVLDNLDRVTKEKLREVWSDIEVFTSIAEAKIQLVIPYSIAHVAASLSSESSKEGVEYISKRIPISFRVSPILSADWKNNCERMIVEAGICNDESELKVIISFIDTWAYISKNEITPRFLKKLINSITSLLLANNENISSLTAFFYQLLIQNNNFSLDEILSVKLDDVKLQSMLEKTVKSLEKTITAEEWSKQFVSIHYLSNYNIAESELLTSPLLRALENSEIQPFISKQNIYAYDKILKDIISIQGTEKIVEILSLICDENDERSSEWIDKWLPVINTFIKEDDTTIEEMDIAISAYKKLQKANINIELAQVSNLFEEWNESSDVVLANDNAEEEVNNLYALGNILGIKPEVRSEFSAEMYSKFIWPHREKYPDWKIEEDQLDENQCKAIFKNAKNETEIDKSLLEHISSCYRIGWLSSNKDERLEVLYPEMININDNNRFIELNLYTRDWYEFNQHDYYTSHYPQHNNTKDKIKWLAQAVANIVYHNEPDYIVHFEDNIDLTNEFNKELANCLAVTCSASDIIQQLENDSINGYLFAAVNILIKDRRIHAMSIDSVIEKFNIISKTEVPIKELLKFLASWKRHYEFSLDSLIALNGSFLSSVLEYDEENDWRTLFLDLIDNGGEANIEWWLKQIRKPNNNIKHIFNWFNANGKTFIKSAQLTEALKELFSKTNHTELANLIEPEWVESILQSLSKGSVEKFSRILDAKLVQTTTAPEWLEVIISNCSNYIKLPSAISDVFQKHVLTLFENVVKDQHSASWFDSQSYEFEKWEPKLFSSFVEQLEQYEEENNYIFEKLNSNNAVSSKKSEIEEQKLNAEKLADEKLKEDDDENTNPD